ncbi:unnamed protein product [Chondrus crispus]|uniref:inositol-1,3,4-trisphosphate 5/6-kinase n=1 Tax=Chondrus crispus TaxID=2769 RepID=R7Q4Q4_CHOCR|nr:unnamed protein product [Chondrus crispus]CDF32853.1 unnamed protein product [Chondrus crispus]|eukprot:XP_005712654.1 unnamed protein product [Chondrus crispus]
MAAALATDDYDAKQRCLKLEEILQDPRFPSPRFLSRRDNIPHRSYPVVAIDPLQGVWKLVDRTVIGQAVDKTFGKKAESMFRSGINSASSIPWVQISGEQTIDQMRDLLQTNLNFPIILKRRLACGSQASHEMVIADDIESAISAIHDVFRPGPVGVENGKPVGNRFLKGLARPANHFGFDVIAQEFIADHGGILFKIYAVGKRLVVQPRPGVVRNLKGPSGSYYYFDSQQLGRVTGLGRHEFDANTGRCIGTKAIMPSEKLAGEIVAALSKELGLSLIGVDLVYDVGQKKYYVVDINYFPGYKGIACANRWILQHICDLVWKTLHAVEEGK